MKRIFILAVLSLLSIASVYAGQIQLSTYYPSPFGYYERLKFNPRVALTEPCEIGTVYYLAGTGLRYCDDTTVWKNVGSSVWTQNVNDIYPIDTTINPNLKVGIGTTTPEFRLTLDNDGGILSKGTYGSGSVLLTSGAGARLIWYPRKAAFRVGVLDSGSSSTRWDDANIGAYSVAMGRNPRASGSGSIALGYWTTASASFAIAIGKNNVASGAESIAMGYGTTTSGLNSTAMGVGTTANGDISTATGRNTTASGYASTAMGDGTTASNYSSMAIGVGTTASGYASTAMGAWTTASGGFSTAIGLYPTAQAYASVVLGQYNVITGNTTTWVATDPLFVIGNGADAGNPSNALTVLKDGNTGIGTASPRTRLELGNDGAILATGTVGAGWTEPNLGAGTRLLWYPRKAAFRAGSVGGAQWNGANIGDYSVAMGRNTSAIGNNSTAMGVGTWASGTASTAMGTTTSASGLESTAMGNSTTASGLGSTAMGSATVASGTASTAMGGSSTASGDYSTAMGGQVIGWPTATTASGQGSTAMGGSSTASGLYSTAFGNRTTASGDSSTAMGNLTTASGEDSTAIGLSTTAQAYASVVLGRFNVISGTTNVWNAGEPLFVIGNGSGDLTRSNALTVLKNGNTGIGTAAPQERLHVTSVMRLTPTDAPGLCNAPARRGSIYYDLSLSRLCHCDGTSWKQVDGGGGC